MTKLRRRWFGKGKLPFEKWPFWGVTIQNRWILVQHHLCAFQAGPGPVSEREHLGEKSCQHTMQLTRAQRNTSPKNTIAFTQQSKQVLTAFDATLKVTGDKRGNQYVLFAGCFGILMFNLTSTVSLQQFPSYTNP